MKNKFRFYGIIAIFAVIGLVLVACGGDCTHDNGAWHTTNAGTCTLSGTRELRCTKCSDVLEKSPIPATGHNYSIGICTIAGCYSIQMMPISAGNFVRDGHTITLSAFKMSRFQVTQELYEAVIGNNPSWFHGGSGREPDTTNGVLEIQGRRPVERVTWFDAVYFCNKLSERAGLTPVYTITNIVRGTDQQITSATVTANWNNNGYRLPTEAQWEYACRAGSTALWHFGDNQADLLNHAWFGNMQTGIDGNANGRTHQVGLKTANVWGLHDMHGNVWEWVWDWWGTFPNPSDLDNPRGAVSGTGRVNRGGSWGDSASSSQSAFRFIGVPGYRDFIFGFRLALP
ncbi:MAG: formylglycine-generating enzyme family protein [Treponema sp.]|jgi:formylglycine-generating enzyme required for sulfatase activity|nr:formylglycine-generating enzyme family protein [Treponema sp.]